MLKKLIFSSLFLLFVLGAFGAQIQAQTVSDAITGLDQTKGQVTAFQNQTVDNSFVQTRAGQLIGVVLSFVGIIFLILMVFAGITWMTAQGNSQQVDKAKDLLVNSIIGIVIVFAAYAITAYVGDFVSKQLLQ